MVCRSEHAKKNYVKNKEHINKINAKWKAENADKHHEINSKYRLNNPKKIKESGKKWYAGNRDERRKTIHKWYVENTEKVIKKNAEWKLNNPERAKIMRKKSGAKRRSTPRGKLHGNISSAIGFSLRGNKRGRKWESLVGFTLDELLIHLEKKFKAEMNWSNYGSYWEIDHKIPVVAFNFSNSEDIDFKKCWCLKNLQPLEVSINRSKYCRLNKPFQPSLLLQEVMNG